jgi:hypothetical protein
MEALLHCFLCPGCGESIFLPRQSSLGIADALLYLTTSIWPIRFLCSRLERMYEVRPVAVHLGTEAVRHLPNQPSLWEIDCECSLESCGKRHCIYTTLPKESEPRMVTRLLLKSNPLVSCIGGHPAKFRGGNMIAYRLE